MSRERNRVHNKWNNWKCKQNWRAINSISWTFPDGRNTHRFVNRECSSSLHSDGSRRSNKLTENRLFILLNINRRAFSEYRLEWWLSDWVIGMKDLFCQHCYLPGYLVPYWRWYKCASDGGHGSGNVRIRQPPNSDAGTLTSAARTHPAHYVYLDKRGGWLAFSEESGNPQSVWEVHGYSRCPCCPMGLKVNWVKEHGFQIKYLALDLAYWPKTVECD